MDRRLVSAGALIKRVAAGAVAIVVDALVDRWRGGVRWQRGERCELAPAELTPAQLLQLLTDQGFRLGLREGETVAPLSLSGAASPLVEATEALGYAQRLAEERQLVTQPLPANDADDEAERLQLVEEKHAINQAFADAIADGAITGLASTTAAVLAAENQDTPPGEGSTGPSGAEAGASLPQGPVITTDSAPVAPPTKQSATEPTPDSRAKPSRKRG